MLVNSRSHWEITVDGGEREGKGSNIPGGPMGTSFQCELLVAMPLETMLTLIDLIF